MSRAAPSLETLAVSGMDCAECAAKLESAVARLNGVEKASVSFTAATLQVEYLPDRVERSVIVGRIRGLGYDVIEPESAGVADGRRTEFRLTGLDCVDCAAAVERNVAAMSGVSGAEVRFAASTLCVTHSSAVTTEAIVRVVEASGYGAIPGRALAAERERSFVVRNRRALLTAGSGVALGVAVLLEKTAPIPLFGGLGGGLELPHVIYVLAMLVGGYHIARAGLYSLVRTRTLDMNLLMTIAAIGAVAIGEWTEGATVVFLFALGNALEGYTMDRARGAIRALLSIAPTEARVRRGGAEVAVAAADVAVGELVVVRPGEKIPVDGRVVGGASGVNQAPVTGESVPVEKVIGDEVFAGSLNERGYLEVEATRPYAENTISRIVQLVEQAQAEKAPSQRFVDRFARYYTPVVIGGAVAVAAIPPLFLAQPFEPWFYRALVLLVISCPCALVISTPVSIVSAIARAAGLGVLVKGGVYLEELGRIRVVAFDKTGTLTVGRPEVVTVVPLADVSAEEVLHLAASLEARSEHPLATAIVRRAEASDGAAGHRHMVEEFAAIPGRGVSGLIDGVEHYVGSPQLLEERGISLNDASDRLRALEEQGQTVLVVGRVGQALGLVAVADRLRPGARAAVAALRRVGVERVVLLTGDHEATARAISRAVGIDDFRSGLLPADKVAAVRALRQEHGSVAMVGDGVNDAPALAAASVGIAMGAAGTDAALEAADVALMSDDLEKVAEAIELGRRALGTIRANIGFSLAVKAVFLIATVPGLVTLWLAIAADMGASLVVTLNGMRLLADRREVAAHHEHSTQARHADP